MFQQKRVPAPAISPWEFWHAKRHSDGSVETHAINDPNDASYFRCNRRNTKSGDNGWGPGMFTLSCRDLYETTVCPPE